MGEPVIIAASGVALAVAAAGVIAAVRGRKQLNGGWQPSVQSHNSEGQDPQAFAQLGVPIEIRVDQIHSTFDLDVLLDGPSAGALNLSVLPAGGVIKTRSLDGFRPRPIATTRGAHHTHGRR